MAMIASGNDPIGTPAIIKVSTNGDEISLDGNITSGVSKKLRQTLEATPNARKLLLKSHGGRILEALAMVDLIKARRLDTRVVEDCESACTLLFLAGAERSASPLAAIGFHQPDFPGLSSQQRDSMIQSNREDYRAAGISDEFIDRIMATSPEQMWYPTGDEMTEAGVLNTIVVSSHRSDRELSRLNEALGQAVTNINSKRGTMVDNITQLKWAELNGEVIIVDYAVTKPIQLSGSQFSNAITPLLRKKMCSGPDRALISSGGKYRFNYHYESGRSVGTVLVDHC